MDLSKIFSAAGSIPGASKLIGNLAGLGNIEALKAKAAQQLGIDPKNLDEFEQEAKAILADGALTSEEMRAALSKVAQAKGIPQQAIDMAMKMLQQKMGGQ